MFSRILCKMSNLINWLNKTECPNCRYYKNGFCINSMREYAGCCGWKNRNYKEKL